MMSALKLAATCAAYFALRAYAININPNSEERADPKHCQNFASRSSLFRVSSYSPTRSHSLQNQLGRTQWWSSNPACLPVVGDDTHVCAYTDVNFSNGRGVSIIGTPQSVELVAKHKAFQNVHFNDLPSFTLEAPFEVMPLAGRGFGLIANRTILPGEPLFAHSPVLLMQAAIEGILDEDSVAFLLRIAIQNLPHKTRDLFLALHGHFGGDHVYDRFNTNAFNIYDYAAVFPETSRLNHACRPNANYYFDKSLFTHHVNAVRHINVGEEITISYISHYLDSSQRSKRIESQWGFKCSCSLCSGPGEFIRQSDARLSLIQDVEKRLQDNSPDRQVTTSIAENLVSLYEQEDLHAPIAQAYIYAALEYSYHGNKAMVLEYAAKALRTATLWKGPRNADVLSMKSLLDAPERHPSWMMNLKA